MMFDYAKEKRNEKRKSYFGIFRGKIGEFTREDRIEMWKDEYRE